MFRDGSAAKRTGDFISARVVKRTYNPDVGIPTRAFYTCVRTYVQCLIDISPYRRVELLLLMVTVLVVDTHPIACAAHDPVYIAVSISKPFMFTLGCP